MMRQLDCDPRLQVSIMPNLWLHKKRQGLSQKILNLHRQFPHANTGGMVDSIRDRGGNSGQTNLTYSARADLVEFFVRVVEEMHVDCRSIRIHSNYVVCHTAINRGAVLRIVFRTLKQRHANAHHDRSLYLVAACQRVDDLPGIDDSHYAAHAQSRDLRLPGNLGEVAAERLRRELWFRVTECRSGLAVARNQTQV